MKEIAVFKAIPLLYFYLYVELFISEQYVSTLYIFNRQAFPVLLLELFELGFSISIRHLNCVFLRYNFFFLHPCAF